MLLKTMDVMVDVPLSEDMEELPLISIFECERPGSEVAVEGSCSQANGAVSRTSSMG